MHTDGIDGRMHIASAFIRVHPCSSVVHAFALKHFQAFALLEGPESRRFGMKTGPDPRFCSKAAKDHEFFKDVDGL